MNLSKQSASAVLALLLVACATPTIVADPSLQGRWEATFSSTTDLGTNGAECTDGTGAFEITGLNLAGVAKNEYNQVYSVVGSQMRDGTIKGEFNLRDTYLGTFEGRLTNGELRGAFVDTELCRGNWRAVKVSS